MSKIAKIRAREILDSRGNPTVETEVYLESGAFASAMVPSGASTGTYESWELRDNDQRYGGKGVRKAVGNVNEKINDEIKGCDVFDQAKIDEKMIALDGTVNKSNLGANAILGVSLAVCRAAAIEKGVHLFNHLDGFFEKNHGTSNIPVPMCNVINGGMHSDSGLAIQEFMIVPKGIATFSEQIRAASEIFHALKGILAARNLGTSVGDEGGFAPKLESNTQALELMLEAVVKAGYVIGEQIFCAVDSAANSFYKEESDSFIFKPEAESIPKEILINVYKEWIDKFNLISIEDGLPENDWEGWRNLNEKVGKKIMLIGDDLIVTNVERLQKAINERACNAVLIKVNQIGTLTETVNCIKLARNHDMKIIVSHRSGETPDDFIADLAFASGAEFLKAGSLSRGERVCKYNRLAKIEEIINSK